MTSSDPISGSAFEISADSFAAYEAISLPVVITRLLDGKILFANRAFCRFHGLSFTEVMRTSAEDLYTRPNARKEMLTALHTNERLENYVVETRRIGSGSTLWVSLSIERIRINDEAGLCTIIVDVSEPLRAHGASEQSIRLLTEDARDILFRYEFGIGFTYVGPPATRILGYAPEDFYANPELYKSILHAGSLQQLRDFLQFSNEADGRQELQLYHRDGHTVWVEHRILPVYDDEGQRVAATGLVRDITERKLSELTTERQAQEFRALAENSPNMIARLDRQVRPLYVNPALVAYGRRPAEEYTGRPVRAFLRSQSVVELLENAVHEVFATGSAKTVEIVWETQDRAHVFEARLAPEFSEDGAVQTVLVIAHDITDRVRAEQISRQATQQMQSVLDSLTAQIIVLDRRGQITMTNQVWRQFHNRLPSPATGVAGDSFFDYLLQNIYLLPEQAQEIKSGVGKVAIGDSAEYRCEFAYWLPTSACWMLLSAAPFDGPEQGAVVTMIDITESKAHEYELEMMVTVRRELRHARTRAQLLEITANLLGRILRSSEVTILTRDPQTKEHLVELATGGWSWAIGHLLSPEQGATGIVVATGKPYITEDLAASGVAYQSHRYARRQAALVVPLAIDETIVGTLAVGRDLETPGNGPYMESDVRLMTAIADVVASALQRATLHEQREQLLEVVDEGLVLLDARLRVTIANPAAQEHLRLLGSIEAGQPLVKLADRPLRELVASTDTPYHEIVVGTPDPHTFEVMVLSLPQAMEREGWVLVTRDVTALRQLQDMNMQQERLAAVGQLATGLAHDLNNKLGVIGLHAELLLHSAPLAQSHQELLTTIHEQVGEAGQLMQQILDFSRRSVFARRPVSMKVLIPDLIAVWRRTMPKSIEIQYVAKRDDCECIVMGDAARLRQAMMNLALNARDAMPDGGVLTVQLDATPPPSALATADGSSVGEEEWLCITVSDTGTGIPPDDQAHVVEPFFTTRSRSQHAGLGLSQVHGIVNQLDGYVQLTSELDVGTTVRLYLPYVDEQIVK